MFDAQQFLDEHSGDPLAALKALAADRDSNLTGRNAEGQSAARARRERDEARARAQQLEEDNKALTARVPAEGAVSLTADEATTWQQVQERGGLTAWDADRTSAQEGQQARQQALALRLAAAQGWDATKTQKLLGGRTLTEQPVERDGQQVSVIGFQQGEAFTDASAELADFADSLRHTTPITPAVRVITQPGSRDAGKAENPVLAQQRARYHRPGQGK